MKSSDDVANKWSNNLAAAGPAIKAGVMAVSVNPAERAANRQDAWLAGVQRAAANGKYVAGLRRVTLQSWQNDMVNKGLNRIASGAANAKPKFANFMSKFLPYQEQLKQKLQSQPRGDLEANIARMVTAVRHNAAFVYTP